MPQKLHKDTAFNREEKNKHKKKCPFPQKKAKNIPKHHFRKLHVSTTPIPNGMRTTSLFRILSPLYSTSSTSLIPLPPIPSLHSPKIDVGDID